MGRQRRGPQDRRQRPHAGGGVGTLPRRVPKVRQRDSSGLCAGDDLDRREVALFGMRGVTPALGEVPLEQAREVVEAGIGNIAGSANTRAASSYLRSSVSTRPSLTRASTRSGRNASARRNSAAATPRSPRGWLPPASRSRCHSISWIVATASRNSPSSTPSRPEGRSDELLVAGTADKDHAVTGR